PMQAISADHVVGLPTSSRGNACMLVMIDHCTRFLFAIPTGSLSAATFIDHFQVHVLQRFASTNLLVSDNGPAFSSRHTKKFFQRNSIEHLYTPPYTPESNGIVERVNGTITASLKKVCLNRPRS